EQPQVIQAAHAWQQPIEQHEIRAGSDDGRLCAHGIRCFAAAESCTPEGIREGVTHEWIFVIDDENLSWRRRTLPRRVTVLGIRRALAAMQVVDCRIHDRSPAHQNAIRHRSAVSPPGLETGMIPALDDCAVTSQDAPTPRTLSE